MPTYEYRCKSCKHTFEVFHSMTADPVLICPECGNGVERLIGSGAGPIFKGKGFYQTDYKNNSSASASKSKAKDTPAEKPVIEKKESTKKSTE